MSGKSRRASTAITLASTHLDGYSGLLDVVAYPRRSWWRRLLRLKTARRSKRVYAHVTGATARAWWHR